MSLVVDAPEATAVDMAVQLRRRQRTMAQELLDGSEVGAAFHWMRRERMSQPVWVGEYATQRRGVEPLATRRQEQRVLRARHQLRSRFAEIARKQMARFLAERDEALLAALALT